MTDVPVQAIPLGQGLLAAGSHQYSTEPPPAGVQIVRQTESARKPELLYLPQQMAPPQSAESSQASDWGVGATQIVPVTWQLGVPTNCRSKQQTCVPGLQ